MESVETVLYATRKYTPCPYCLTLIPEDEYIEHIKDCRENLQGDK
jgi:hypothetical protein